jgi:hypothetical protein
MLPRMWSQPICRNIAVNTDSSQLLWPQYSARYVWNSAAVSPEPRRIPLFAMASRASTPPSPSEVKWLTSQGISAWQKKNVSRRASASGPVASVGCQNRNATKFRAMMARVSQAKLRVGLSS